MKKIFSMVFLALVVSGAVIVGDVREAKADWGSLYSVRSVSVYFTLDGQPYRGLRVEIHDTQIPDAENPMLVYRTNSSGYVPVPDASGRYWIKFITPGGTSYFGPIDTSITTFELAGW